MDRMTTGLLFQLLLPVWTANFDFGIVRRAFRKPWTPEIHQDSPCLATLLHDTDPGSRWGFCLRHMLALATDHWHREADSIRPTARCYSV
ncbi:hypothetical protein GGR56DRAFT_628009 [Xylariaceae sp. FL0804]|nr:hypothetical protein GGR56DRAFT_628009 [Xylariaceae sp. FL0804]